jgi:Zn-dependent metalloprotease
MPDQPASVETALAFLEKNLPFLAPRVLVSELRLKALPYDCQVAPTFQGKGGKTFTFERVIDGLPVVGGSIAVRVEGNGAVVKVYNSLALVPKRRISPNVISTQWCFTKIPAKRSRPRFDKLLTEKKQRNAVVQRSKEVLLPINAGASGGLMNARHISWANSQGELMSGFLLSDQTVVEPTVVPATMSKKSIPRVHLDEQTKLPTFISYRPQGGLSVSEVGVFDNPAEIAYRYLEENPDVFRTGAARCQFEVIDIRKSNGNPGTSFVKMGQIMAGRTVFGAELVFEIEGGNRIQTIQGHTIAHPVRIVPEISPEAATARASGLLNVSLAGSSENFRAQANQRPITVELVIFPGELVAQKGLGKNPRTALAYHTQSLLYGLFIDAVGGEILYGYSLLQGANVVMEAGGKTILEKPFFTEVGRDGVPTNPGTPLSADAATAVPLLTTTDAFYRAHGWIGTNGRGSDLVANVNVNLFTCPNAFSPPINEQSYFCSGEVVPDIVAHELTHGVIWNSSNLVYGDESGALNESYADIMGNLAFPDAIPTSWLVGEGSAGFIAGSFRNMASPGASRPAQPGNYSGYLSRTAMGCSAFDTVGLGCDFGGVHRNSGITNLAHVLMSDGRGGLTGMGRGRLRMLAFDVMTLRLSKLSRLVDSALATRASCDAMLARGGTDLTGAPFRQIDCDQIPGAFATVGLDPDLVPDWVPPTAGFSGTIARFPGDVTENGCTITDLTLQMSTPSGQIDSQASVVGLGTALSTNYFGLMTASIATTAPPIGTTSKGHTIAWTSDFGETPIVDSALSAPPPPGLDNCRGGPAGTVTETQRSAPAVSSGIPYLGGSSGSSGFRTGNAASAMNAACRLVPQTKVEIIDDAGNPISDAQTAPTWSQVVWIAFVPVTLTRTATVTASAVGATPGGAGNFDLSAPVAWTYSPGVPDVRWRLVYTIDKPAGVTCTP